MSKSVPAVAGILFLSAVVIESGTETAQEAIDAIVITVAVFIVLSVLGLIALVLYRTRTERIVYRPDIAVTRGYTVRAELVSSEPAASGSERPGEATGRRTPLALPPAAADRP